jgi:3-dehydroquinate synthase
LRTVRVSLGKRSYEARIGHDLLGWAGKWLRQVMPSAEKAALITNPEIDRLYGAMVKQGLEKEGFKIATLLVPEGEEHKTLDTAAKLYAGLQAVHAERSTPILAMGGGVIGDLAGFVAATYMRGLPLVLLPTTLLAQVDSSLGGKTAVDHGPVKNNIGVFHQPLLVIADTFALRSLPQAEVSNGLAEVIKYGMIRDGAFFKLLEKNIEKIRAFEDPLLEEAVARSAAIKAAIVSKDERDAGIRNILNFGHTIGHAVESASDFRIRHGQAVATGMVKASAIACRLGLFPRSQLNRLKNLLLQAGLPVTMPEVEMARVIAAMEHDKKVQGGKVRFILPRSIGRVFIANEVSFALAVEVMEGGDD